MVVRVKFNKEALYQLRTSEPGIINDLDKRAEAIAAEAGDGYVTNIHTGKKAPQGRHQANVGTSDYASKRDNAKNNTLIKSLGAGRG